MHGNEEGLDVKGIVWCISSGCEYVTKHKEELSSHGWNRKVLNGSVWCTGERGIIISCAEGRSTDVTSVQMSFIIITVLVAQGE